MKLLKVKDLANTLKVAEQTLRTWIRRRNIPVECVVSIGSTKFIIEERFYNWLEMKGDTGVGLSEK